MPTPSRGRTRRPRRRQPLGRRRSPAVHNKKPKTAHAMKNEGCACGCACCGGRCGWVVDAAPLAGVIVVVVVVVMDDVIVVIVVASAAVVDAAAVVDVVVVVDVADEEVC